MIRGLFIPLVLLLVLFVQPLAAIERYAVSGMVLEVNEQKRTFVASIDDIKGYMPAMTMPFQVKDAKELTELVPGAIIDFTLVVDKTASFVEGIRVRRYQNLEQDPL